MKYEPLEHHLRTQGSGTVAMSFKDIERLIHANLPPSARRHRAWWSNNPSNSVATYAWINAGYRSTKVDMAGERLVFERNVPASPSSVSEPGAAAYASAAPASLYGYFRGAFKILAGSDLTQPAPENWAANRDE